MRLNQSNNRADFVRADCWPTAAAAADFFTTAIFTATASTQTL
jgi:hypothetical protein